MAATMISIGFHNPLGDWHLAPHQHSDYEMIAVVKGAEDMAIGSHKLTARAGDILMLKPGVAHEEWSWANNPLETYFMSFSWPGNTSHWPLHSIDAQGRIRLLSSWLHATRDAHAPETRAAADAFFLALIREFLRLQNRQENPLVTSVRDFVRRNISAPLSLDLLAKHAGLSKFYFIRRYRKLTGRSPMEDARMIRISQARDIIMTSNLPLKAIAAQTGLGDEISLCRLFRRHLNTTPGHFRHTTHK